MKNPGKHLWILIASSAFSGHVFSATPQQVAFHYAPSPANIQRLRAARICPMNISEFSISPAAVGKIDNEIPFGGGFTFVVPEGNSFAQYLRDAIATDFRYAAKLDTQSAVVLTGQLTTNVIHANMSSVADGTVGAQFQLRRGAQVVYEKEFTVDAVWDSPFGAVSSWQEAKSQYANLYQRLIARLIGDPAFISACAAE